MYYVKQFLRQLVFAIIFWSFAFCLFILIRFLAVGEEQVQEIENPKNIVPITEWLYFGIILGVLVGTFYAIVEFLFDKFISKNIFLGLSVVLKTLIYVFVLVFSLTFIVTLIELEMDLDLKNERGWWVKSNLFWLATAYFFISSFVFLFIKMAHEKFGRGILFKTLIGKYRKPKEEDRVFMFIDLKSSTTIAEQIGHYKYSQLLQDCFFDLNKVVGRYNGEIYQYVGDEAVISWKTSKAIKHNDCIDLYFTFDKMLKKRSKYYQKHYNLDPFFKAGLHGGKLIIAEVGAIKKELAFHGDVINTTARIQEECNKYNEPLLISNKLLDKIKLKSKYKSQSIGNILLKGKQEHLQISAINEA